MWVGLCDHQCTADFSLSLSVAHKAWLSRLRQIRSLVSRNELVCKGFQAVVLFFTLFAAAHPPGRANTSLLTHAHDELSTNGWISQAWRMNEKEWVREWEWVTVCVYLFVYLKCRSVFHGLCAPCYSSHASFICWSVSFMLLAQYYHQKPLLVHYKAKEFFSTFHLSTWCKYTPLQLSFYLVFSLPWLKLHYLGYHFSFGLTIVSPTHDTVCPSIFLFFYSFYKYSQPLLVLW